MERKIEHLATKEDLTKFSTKLSDVKADVIKWLFFFWIGQIAVIVGLVLAVLKK